MLPGPSPGWGGDQQPTEGRWRCRGEACPEHRGTCYQHSHQPEPAQEKPEPGGLYCHPEKGSRGTVVRTLTSSNEHTASQGALRQPWHTRLYCCTTLLLYSCVQLYTKLLLSKSTKGNEACERKEAASALCSQETAGERGPATSVVLHRRSAVGPARALLSLLPI